MNPLDRFVTAEDHSEMMCIDCGGWIHTGSHKLSEVVQLAETHAAGCVPIRPAPWAVLSRR